MKKYGELYNNFNLKNNNTYKIESIAKYYIIVNDVIKLKELIKYLDAIKEKYFIIGNGSNIILPSFYDGVVIKLNFNNLIIEENNVEVGSSYMINKLSLDTVNNNLKGLEWAAGIPGTIGASIIGNSSCYEGSLMPLIKKLDVLINNEIKIITTDDFNYSYRHTTLKDDKVIILKAYLELEEGNKEELLEIIKDRTKKRIDAQPLEYPSAGSVFRNPVGYFAGKLIEDEGLKGYSIGGAMVSEKHANFIINKDNATSEDIIKLITEIQDIILEKHEIYLILEQEIIV